MTGAAVTRPMHPSFLVPFAGLLFGMNAFSNDILLPAFFGIAQSLEAPIERVQTLVPLFLMAAGFGQLLSGPLSDRFGRRPLLLAGLMIFFSGSLACALAATIGGLQIGRMVQGFGSAFLVVMARASLRDTQSDGELARAMALASALFALGPIIAPMTGVGLMALGGWRAVFVGIMTAVAGLAVATLVGYRETNLHRDPRALDPARLRDAVRQVFGHRQSRTFLLTSALLQFGIVAVVSNSPRLFKSQFGIEGAAYALLFAISAAGIAVGQWLNHRLIGRVGVFGATRMAAGALAAVCTTFVVAALAGWRSPALFLVQLTVFNAAFLVIISNAASLVLAPHRKIAGLTASLFGFVTQLTGSLLALATFGVIGGDLLRWSLALLVTTSIVFVAIVRYRP